MIPDYRAPLDSDGYMASTASFRVVAQATITALRLFPGGKS